MAPISLSRSRVTTKLMITVVKAKKAAAEEMAASESYIDVCCQQPSHAHSYFRRGCSNYAKYALLISRTINLNLNYSIFPPMKFSLVSELSTNSILLVNIYVSYIVFVVMKSDAKGHQKLAVSTAEEVGSDCRQAWPHPCLPWPPQQQIGEQALKGGKATL